MVNQSCSKAQSPASSAFVSAADNLVAGDTNGSEDIFVHDRITGRTTRVSLASDGAQGNAASTGPVTSEAASYIAFVSDADNLVPGDTNSEQDIFLRITTLAALFSFPG